MTGHSVIVCTKPLHMDNHGATIFANASLYKQIQSWFLNVCLQQHGQVLRLKFYVFHIITDVILNGPCSSVTRLRDFPSGGHGGDLHP